MEDFAYILEKYNWPRRTKSSNTSFEKIEKVIGFKISSDYKSFLQLFCGNERLICCEFVCLWDIDEIIKANIDYGIIENLTNTIGIGTNGGGEFIGIEKTSEKEYRIVLSPLIGLDEKDHINIGSSFSDFLIRLDNGQEWFDK